MIYLFLPNGSLQPHLTREHRLCFNRIGAPKEQPAFPKPPEGRLGWLLAYIRGPQPDFDVESTRNLTDDRQWLSAFQLSGFPNQPVRGPLDPKEENINPLRFLEALEPEVREQIFATYVARYIPFTVLVNNGLADAADPNDHTNLLANIGDVTDAMEGILGLNGRDKKYFDNNGKNTALKIATETLTDLYDPTGFPNVKNNLESDFLEAREFSKLRHIPAANTDPKILASLLAPSRFRAALQLGVVDRTLLEKMQPTLKEVEFVGDQKEMDARVELEKLTGSSEKTLKKQAETISDMAKKIPTWMWIVMAATTFYGMSKSKTLAVGVPVAGGIVGALYLFQKAVLKHDKPTEQWASFFNGATEAVRGKVAGLVGKENMPPAGVTDIGLIAKPIARFMRKRDMENMTTKTIGLGLLTDMPLSLLAKNFTIDPYDNFSLNTQAMDAPLHQAASMHGWADGYRTFFANSRNKYETSEAVGNFLYFRAIQDNRNDPDAILTERVYDSLVPGTSLSILHYPTTDPRYVLLSPDQRIEREEARRAYLRLVSKGRDAWSDQNVALGQSIVDEQQNMGFFNVGYEDIDPKKGAAGAKEAPEKDPRGKAADKDPRGARPDADRSGGKPPDDDPSRGKGAGKEPSGKPADASEGGKKGADSDASGKKGGGETPAGKGAGDTGGDGKKGAGAEPGGVGSRETEPGGKADTGGGGGKVGPGREPGGGKGSGGEPRGGKRP